MKQKYTHGFIGIGKMAQVILQAMLTHQHTKPGQVLVSRRNSQALKKLARTLKVATTTQNMQVAAQCRYVWLGIKPFQAHEVLAGLSSHLRPNTTVISMMTGVSTAWLRSQLGCEIIRIMPNTPALLGKGMTGIYFPPKTSKPTRQTLLHILNDLGKVAILRREKDFDEMTGLSGSGPAFVYTVAQGLIQGGVASGLTKTRAREWAIQTLAGAVAMLQETGQDPEKLIAQVVSKGGTTEAGLKILKQHKTAIALKQAVQAATRRAAQISRGFR